MLLTKLLKYFPKDFTHWSIRWFILFFSIPAFITYFYLVINIYVLNRFTETDIIYWQYDMFGWTWLPLCIYLLANVHNDDVAEEMDEQDDEDLDEYIAEMELQQSLKQATNDFTEEIDWIVETRIKMREIRLIRTAFSHWRVKIPGMSVNYDPQLPLAEKALLLELDTIDEGRVAVIGLLPLYTYIGVAQVPLWLYLWAYENIAYHWIEKYDNVFIPYHAEIIIVFFTWRVLDSTYQMYIDLLRDYEDKEPVDDAWIEKETNRYMKRKWRRRQEIRKRLNMKIEPYNGPGFIVTEEEAGKFKENQYDAWLVHELRMGRVEKDDIIPLLQKHYKEEIKKKADGEFAHDVFISDMVAAKRKKQAENTPIINMARERVVRELIEDKKRVDKMWAWFGIKGDDDEDENR